MIQRGRISPLGHPACGLTLVELAVAVGVIAILLALILPAVMSAREAARRVECSNNLKQIGVALNAYVTAHGVVPSDQNGGPYSPHVMLLPYMELTPLYDAVNFDDRAPHMPGSANRTVFHMSLPLFLCPSDRQPGVGDGWTNYAGNRGCGIQAYGLNGVFGSPKGLSIRPASIIDGTSGTAAFSEWVLGRYGSRDSLSGLFETAAGLDDRETFDEFARACHGLDPGQSEIGPGTKGTPWMVGDVMCSLYVHVLPVNDHSCMSGGLVQQGAWTAGSLHPGGCNVLFVDGHVQFLKQTIALTVWRALGSRNGSETVSAADY